MRQAYTLLLFIFSVGLTSAVSGQTLSQNVATQKEDTDSPAVVLTVTAPTQTVLGGTNVTLALQVSDTTGNGVLGYRGEITYDPTVLQTVGGNAGCTTAGTISSASAPFCSENVINATTRKINFFIFGSSFLIGAGDLIRFNFLVIGSAGTFSPILFTDFFFNEGGPGDPVDVTVNGVVTVSLLTAAGATVSGRVFTPNGLGLRNAIVTMTSSEGIVKRTISSSLGYYSFDEIQTGQTYIVEVASKRFQFTPRALTVDGDITNWDLIADAGD